MSAQITTYAGLQSAVAAWLARDGDTDLSSRADGFMALEITPCLSLAARADIGAADRSVAQQFAEMAAQTPGVREGSGQNILPLFVDRGGWTNPHQSGEPDHEVEETLFNALDNGYGTVRLPNYSTLECVPAQTIWMLKDPNQLRSPFARLRMMNEEREY